jgi:hypothetical protein
MNLPIYDDDMGFPEDNDDKQSGRCLKAVKIKEILTPYLTET